MKCEKLFEIIDGLENEYLDFFVDVLNIESPTDCKSGVDAVGKYFIKKAKKFGWDVDICRQEISGDCICITMNPQAKLSPVVLSGHMDTVHSVGSFGTPAAHIADGKVYGPGATDCKGGIVAAFMAMAALHELGFKERTVKLLLQSDEENSSLTSAKATVRYMAQQSRDCIAFLNCEGLDSDSEKIVLERKAIVRYVFEISGKSVHSSKCYEGKNAVCEAAHKIIELEKWKDKDGITCNCGVINGGTVPNSVAEKCTFTADIRYKRSSELDLITARVNEIAQKSYIGGTECNIYIKSSRVPMEMCERNIELYNKISRIYDENGLSHRVIAAVNGGSDAADISYCGIPCVDCMGIKGKNIHSLQEYADADSLSDTAKRLAAIVQCI